MPVIVNDESPTVLRFRLPPKIVFRGRVVDGMTGEPMRRAWVVSRFASLEFVTRIDRTVESLTDEDWKIMRAMPDVARPNDAAYQIIDRLYQPDPKGQQGIDALVRTDHEGRFELTQLPTQKLHCVMAFAENAVPLMVKTTSVPVGENQEAAMGDLPLFPAARVKLTPIVDERVLRQMIRWVPDDEQDPWVSCFRAIPDGCSSGERGRRGSSDNGIASEF